MYESYFYSPQTGLRSGVSAAEMASLMREENSLLWVDIQDMDDEDIDLLTNVFGLHPLTIEDFIMVNSRPKVENFKDYTFLVMFSIESYDKSKGRLKTSEIDFCLGKNFLVTAHNEQIGTLCVSKERVKKNSPIVANGADFLLYSLVDCVVDSYFPIITDFDNMVDEMSDELFKDPSNKTLKKIYQLKNEIMQLRRTIGPQADTIALMSRGDFPFILPSNTVYFRNIQDNLIRLNDVVGTTRDIIAGAMEAYVSVVSNRLNEIMKTLTVIATIMMPLTLIASIYGMNFKHMPELASPWGYPFAIGLMLITTVTMLVYFKRKNWL